MSRTNKGSKAPGYEYWSKRPGNTRSGVPPSKYAKTRTHRAERRISKNKAKKEGAEGE